IPNLRQKSTEYAMGLIKRHVFGVKATQPLPPVPQRFWLFFYAITSSIYRVFVGFIIILVVAYKIPVLGLLMAIGGVATWAIVPIFKLVKFLMLEPELHRKRGRAVAFCSTVAAIVIVSIGMIRFWVDIDAQGIVEPDQHEVVHMKVQGFVKEILARDGQMLKKGEAILVCQDRELEAQSLRLHAELRSLLTQEQLASVEDQAQRKIVHAAVGAVREQLDDTQEKLDDLTIRAPIDGVLIAPKLDEMAGAYIPRGQEIATVAAMDNLLIRTLVQQEDAQLLHDDTTRLLAATPEQGSTDAVQVQFAGDIKMRGAVPAAIEAIIHSSQDTVPHPS